MDRDEPVFGRFFTIREAQASDSPLYRFRPTERFIAIQDDPAPIARSSYGNAFRQYVQSVNPVQEGLPVNQPTEPQQENVDLGVLFSHTDDISQCTTEFKSTPFGVRVTIKDRHNLSMASYLNRASWKKAIKAVYAYYDVRMNVENEPWNDPANMTYDEAIALIIDTAARHNLSVELMGNNA